MGKRPLILAAKVSISVLLLWYLVSAVDLGALAEGLLQADLAMFLLAVASYILMVGLDATRLYVMARVDGVTLGQSLSMTFKCLTFLNVLPGNIGGDAYRFAQLREITGGSSRPLTVLFSLRLISLLIISLGALASAIIYREQLQGLLSVSDRALVFLIIAGLVSAFVLLAVWLRTSNDMLEKAFSRIGDAVKMIAPAALIKLIGITIVMNTIRLVMFWCLSESVGTGLGLMESLAVMCFAVVATALPISIGGIGVREGAIVGMTVALGASAEDGLLIAILARAVLVLASVIGIAAWVSFGLIPGRERRA